MNNTSRTIEKTNNDKEKVICNCLIFTTDESYETKLCSTGHNFYAFNNPNLKTWDTSEYNLPRNYFILPVNEIPQWVRWDVIIVQSKAFQFTTAKKIRDIINVPIITVENSEPVSVPQLEQQVENMKSMIGDINVFNSEKTAELWEIDHNNYIISSEDGDDIFTTKWEVLIETIYERSA